MDFYFQDGFYMPNYLAKECWPCPSGSYCVGDHLSPADCPPGFYCPGGTGFDWKSCPPGTFSSDKRLRNVSCRLQYWTWFFIIWVGLSLKQLTFSRFKISNDTKFKQVFNFLLQGYSKTQKVKKFKMFY